MQSPLRESGGLIVSKEERGYLRCVGRTVHNRRVGEADLGALLSKSLYRTHRMFSAVLWEEVLFGNAALLKNMFILEADKGIGELMRDDSIDDVPLV